MDEKEEIQQNNMISNLPLLFASGYPTSLDKITASQLEKFIPFMVQCSLGHINLQGQFDCSEPEWWPEDIPFNIPFSKPRKFVGNWIEKLKEIVLICYQFHKSVFLLRFCNDLSSYEHASLRFINNYNSTTSLFDRRSNKLLVTFRNENMSYDQPQRLRKCLLQQKPKENLYNGPNVLQQMVEPAPFDIYLCDNCDAELYSKEAILEHEKTCIVEDDDVILCENTESFNNNLSDNIITEDNEQRIGFFLNFNLRYKNCKISSKTTNLICNNECKTTCGASSESGQKESQFMIVDKKKRISRRNRAVHSVSRCPTIPLSSPAGQLLLRTTKTVLTSEYLIERLDRIERFCPAPLVSKFTSRPKFLEKKYSSIPPHCTFKKPQDYSSHLYIFPRRQFQQRRRSENILLINSTLLRRCRPISVRIKKISDLKNKQSLSCSNKLNIKLTRDNSRSSSWKISSCPSAEIIVDTIDLCTSDEEDNQITFCTSNFSYITRTGIVKTDENTNVENNSCMSPLSIHTSLSQIRQQLNYAANSPPLINNSISKTCDSDSTFPQPNIEKSKNNSCFVHIVHKNDNLSNVLSINNNNNKSDSSNGDISSNFIKPFRPSVYILSNGSATALVSTQNINSESDEGSEIVNSATNLKPKSKNWLLSEHDLNIVSEFANSSCENSALASSHSLVQQDDRNRTLPLIVHQNHIVSIDLTS